MILERRTLIVRSPHWLIIAFLGMWIKLETLFDYGAVAQLGERFPCTEEVAGSSPVSSTLCGGSQMVRQRIANPCM